MGLFSSSSKTYVSSVTYPLGVTELVDRVDFAKYTVLNALLQGTDVSNTLTRAYLGGGGMKFRAAYRYARDKYTHGLPSSGMLYSATPDRAVITSIIQAKTTGQVYLNTAALAIADFTFWAERHLAETYGYDRISKIFTRPPDRVEPNATVSYDVERSGWIRILLINSNGFVTEISFYPKDLVSGQLYLHSTYQVVQGFPTEFTTNVRAFITGEVAGSTTVTTTLERENDIQETRVVTTLAIAGVETTVTTATTVRTMSRPKYFLYRVGAGTYPVIDGWRTNGVVSSPYYPSIPLRVDNVSYVTPAREDTPLYKTSDTLLGYAGVDIAEISEKLAANAQIDEIDFAFIQFGVALNSKLPEGKKYIHRFFAQIQNQSAVSQGQFNTWEDDYNTAATDMGATAGDIELGGMFVPGPGFNSSGLNSPPTNRLQIQDLDFNEQTAALKITIEWQWADTTVYTGLIAPGAKPGDCLVASAGAEAQLSLGSDMKLDKSLVYSMKQLTADTYEKITVAGLVYTNHVYKDKTVIVTAHEALTKVDEEGFIVPLSHQLFREMGMKDSTQLSYECLHLVLNSYKVVKKKWYQTGIFKLLLVIVAIVLTVISMGSATPVAAALVKAAAVVMTTLGVSGILAAFIVATVTVVAGMILTKLLTPVLIDAFGEKWGRVLIVLATIAIGNLTNTGTLLGNLTRLPLTAANVIRGTSAVLNLANAYQQGALAQLDVGGQMKKLQADYDLKMEEIEKKTQELLGSSNLIDIQGFIEATAIIMEAPGDFLSRTLLTGSDVATITLGQIENFADVGLQLPNTG